MVRPPLSPASSIGGLSSWDRLPDMRAGTHHFDELIRSDPSKCSPGLPYGGGLMAYTPRQEAPMSSMEYTSPVPYPDLPSRRDGTTFAHTPFTPESSPLLSTDRGESKTTRVDPIISKKSSSTDSNRRHGGRVEKRRKPPRGGLKSGGVTKFVQLDKPLSQHMKDKGDTKIFDVTAHVHRDTRKSEIAEGGKVKRPLNAFLLYRKHVIIFIKDTFLAEENKNNQQVVSRISGDSWKMETDEIKAQFKKLAQEEKKLHGEAFPDYKYTPKTGKKPENDGDGTKPGNSHPKSPSTSSVGGPGNAAASSHAIREPLPPSHRPPSQVGMGEARTMQGSHADSSYTMASQPLQQQLHYSGYNDEFSCNWSQEGLPQAYNYPLGTPVNMQPRQLAVVPAEVYIDPAFLPNREEPVYHWQPTEGVIRGHQGWPEQNYSLNDMGMTMPDLDINGAHSAYLRGQQDDWEIEQLDESGNFSNWMMQEENTAT